MIKRKGDGVPGKAAAASFTNMRKKDEIINTIITTLDDSFVSTQLQAVKDSFYITLSNYELVEKTTDIAVKNEDVETKMIQMFFIAKKVEGCTDKTIQYYSLVTRQFLKKINISICEVTADDIRYYLARRSMEDKISKVTQDNELRILRSFFGWLLAEEYITKNPCLKIKAIKKEQRIKKSFTEIEIETLRMFAGCSRNLAIIDILYSSGIRLDELYKLNVEDINGDECVVYGKGEKERYVYLNAKAQLSIKIYLNEREDNGNALFVSLKKPHMRLKCGGIENLLKEVGKRAGISKVHPHRFRRTSATFALNRGMPIDQVQQMLGHTKIETTTLYAKSDRDNVKSSHKKYVV